MGVLPGLAMSGCGTRRLWSFALWWAFGELGRRDVVVVVVWLMGLSVLGDGGVGRWETWCEEGRRWRCSQIVLWFRRVMPRAS